MIATIHLNNKSDIWSRKISNKVTNNVLPDKLNSQCFFTNMFPKHLLC